jgi:hypothetical protein
MRRYLFIFGLFAIGGLCAMGWPLQARNSPAQTRQPRPNEYGPAGPPPPITQFTNIVPLPSSRTLSPIQLEGKQLFVQRCSVCHLPGNPAYGAIAPLLDAKLLGTFGDAAARTQIMRGSAHMPGFQYVFEASDIDKILGYLKLLSYDPAAKKYIYLSSNSNK